MIYASALHTLSDAPIGRLPVDRRTGNRMKATGRHMRGILQRRNSARGIHPLALGNRGKGLTGLIC